MNTNTTTATEQIPEWEERLGVMLREYGNYMWECGAYDEDTLAGYSALERSGMESKRRIIEYVRELREGK